MKNTALNPFELLSYSAEEEEKNTIALNQYPMGFMHVCIVWRTGLDIIPINMSLAI